MRCNFIIAIICIILLLAGCSASTPKVDTNNEKNIVSNSDTSQGTEEVGKKLSSYQVIYNERNHFRDDIESILYIMRDEDKIPIYKGIDDDLKLIHAKIIEDRFDDYVQSISHDTKTSQKIEPIITLLMVESISSPDIDREQANVYCYNLTFYQSIVNKYEYSEKGALASPSDGIIDYYIINLENIQGTWDVQYFGPNS
jgi:hypothetical protein